MISALSEKSVSNTFYCVVQCAPTINSVWNWTSFDLKERIILSYDVFVKVGGLNEKEEGIFAQSPNLRFHHFLPL